MKVTILAALMLMAAYFLVLYGAVGLIQDKRIFSSAPKENLDAIPDRKARFRGAHIVGWAIEGIAVLLFLGAAVLAAMARVDDQCDPLLPQGGEGRNRRTVSRPQKHSKSGKKAAKQAAGQQVSFFQNQKH